MDLANSIANPSTRINGALRLLIVASAILMMTGVAFGATPSKASLKGSYNFNFSKVRQASWYKNITCTYKSNTTTYTVGGTSAYTEVDNGVTTFDGNGHVSITITQVHKEINQAETNATVGVTCSSKGGITTTSNGYIVYEAPQTGTETGTYTVSSNGTGAITIPGSNGGTLDIDVGGLSSTGIASTILLRDVPTAGSEGPGSDDSLGTGVGVLQ